MTNQEIFELMDRFERSAIRTLRLSRDGTTLEMSKDAPAAPALTSPAAHEPVAVQSAQPAAASSAPCESTIDAPLAGVFYAASAPGEAPFVREGDRVKQGDTVCLMEAMKMISEIPAPCDCVITRVLKENGVLAGYGEPLIGYRPC